MSTYYLNTEPDEFVIARQTNKLKYYQNEIENLNEQITDLFNMLKLNREALKLSIPFSQAPESIQVIYELKPLDDQEEQKIEDLLRQNDELFGMVEQYSKERDLLHRKALINEQISEETRRHEKEVLLELEEQYNDLRRLLQDKETVIHDIEKTKHIFESENVVVKYKEVEPPL
jgi:ATP-dependent Lon protease